MKYTLIYAAIIDSSLLSCKEATKTNQEVVETNPGLRANPSSIPISWVNNRVEKAKKRLDSSEAGIVVWDAMEVMGV